MKIWVLILKEGREVYGWSLDEDLVDTFLLQRNPKCFIKKQYSDDSHLIRSFMNENRGGMLTKDYMFDGENLFELIVTTEESMSVSESCETLRQDIQAIYEKNLQNYYELSEDEQDVVSELCNIYDYNHKLDETLLSIDTYAIFYNLFKKTFNIPGQIDI